MRYAREVRNVVEVEVSYDEERATIRYASKQASPEAMIEALAKGGYRAWDTQSERRRAPGAR